MRGKTIQRFDASIRSYEGWLRAQLAHAGSTLWQSHLREKHAKMRESPFVFLRATY